MISKNTVQWRLKSRIFRLTKRQNGTWGGALRTRRWIALRIYKTRTGLSGYVILSPLDLVNRFLFLKYAQHDATLTTAYKRTQH